MRVASVCSSVGGLDLGLHRAGHETVFFFCEFDAWRRTVLARHWPGVQQHHDLKELRASDIPPCDLLVGGTPCQDLSVAGRRAGLDGERSGLFHAFAQLRLDLYDLHGCAWSLWENVAGALSSNDGHDFATVLASHVGADVPVPADGWRSAGMAAGPWGTAEWRLLDAQFFGVPQRRRRVFVVGHLGAVDPVEVLADRPGREGHPAPGSGSRKGTATGFGGSPRVVGTLTTGGKGKSGTRLGAEEAAGNHIVANTLRTTSRPGSNSPTDVVAFHMAQDPITGAVSPALGENSYIGASTPEGVRRLIPTERERAMGWPDGWTYDRGPSLLEAPQGWPRADRSPVELRPDGRRESATGDGVVAHVAEWIGLGFAGATPGREATDA